MRSLLSILAFLGAFVLALADSSYPSVTIRNGTLIGATMYNVDNFLGIPYAEPPVGNLRLRRPQSISKPFGTLKVQSPPIGCVEMQLSSVNTAGIRRCP